MTLESRGEALGQDDTSRQIRALGPWFHNLRLPSGHQTAPDHPLGDFPAFKWAEIAPLLPADLTGARALDIGCNAGFYSFELARRGAEVLAIDLDERYLEQARWAQSRLDPATRIEFVRMSVYDLVRCREQFDLILFLGVLYHLRYPQLALDLVASLVGDRMILQTLTMPGSPGPHVSGDLGLAARDRLLAPGWPRAAFIEHSLAGDPTNWWAPDDACVQAMVRAAGLAVEPTGAHEIYLCHRAGDPDPSADLREAEMRAALGDRSAQSSHRK